jgi:hypothetical protein
MAHNQAPSRLKPVLLIPRKYVAGLATVMDRGTMSELSTEIF